MHWCIELILINRECNVNVIVTVNVKNALLIWLYFIIIVGPNHIINNFKYQIRFKLKYTSIGWNGWKFPKSTYYNCYLYKI